MITVSAEAVTYALEALADLALTEEGSADLAEQALSLLDSLQAAGYASSVELVRGDLAAIVASE